MKIKNKVVYSVLAGIILIFAGCKREQVLPDHASLKIRLVHHVDNQDLIFNNQTYITPSGDTIKFATCKYYLTNFKLKKGNSVVYTDNTIFYIDADLSNPNIILVDSIPPGTYDSLCFDLGLQPSQNISGFLPDIWDNINMVWPDAMGGGYHFMKMEGYYKAGANYYGFAFHLGRNEHLVKYSLPLNKTLQYHNEPLFIKANMMEWFDTPTLYDLHIHENYTMSNDSSMNVLAKNGADFFNY